VIFSDPKHAAGSVADGGKRADCYMKYRCSNLVLQTVEVDNTGGGSLAMLSEQKQEDAH
jgi:hypothetical protein